jgi:glycerol-3-phosphate acyltransferase PlsY
MVVWLLLFGIKKISSLSAICAVLFVALVAIAFLPPGLLLCSVLFSSALILYKHIPTMMRLIRGQEGRIEKL